MTSSIHSAKFVLEVRDPRTECIAEDALFETEAIDDLCRLVDGDATLEVFQNGAAYELEPDEVEQICARFSVKFDPKNSPVSIRLAQWLDELPYKLHTNRELAMMLTGTKPLACFEDAYPSAADFRLPEHLFDQHVEAGRFVKREYIHLLPGLTQAKNNVKGLRVVLYALKHEEWRMDAFALVQNTAAKTGWNEALERIVGSLLGYEEWQNDAYIQHMNRYEARHRP